MPSHHYAVPAELPREVSVVVITSGKAQHPVGRAVVKFDTVSPGRGIIRKDVHVKRFRASIEIGRLLLPKTFKEVHGWEWQAPEWKQALRIKWLRRPSAPPDRTLYRLHLGFPIGKSNDRWVTLSVSQTQKGD